MFPSLWGRAFASFVIEIGVILVLHPDKKSVTNEKGEEQRLSPYDAAGALYTILTRLITFLLCTGTKTRRKIHILKHRSVLRKLGIEIQDF